MSVSATSPNEIKNREMQLLVEVGVRVGEMKTLLVVEKLQLESENKKLVSDLSQLKLIQAAEINFVYDKQLAQRNLIAQKLRTIIEKFKSLSVRSRTHCELVKFDESPFQTLLDSISQYKDTRTYPEYSENHANKVVQLPQTVTLPLLTDDLMISALLQPVMQECELQKKEICQLKETNLSLIQRKQTLAEAHRSHLEKIKQNDIALKTILSKVHLIYKGIKWDAYHQCISCHCDEDECSTNMRTVHHLMQLPARQLKVEVAQGLIKDLIATLEGFTP